jgi:23S rRNA (pseudouridine1915-N3)-methyltransferase
VHIRLIAVGDRQPSWVSSAFAAYVARLPRQWRFRLDEIPAVQRRKGDAQGAAALAEGEKVLARLKPAERVVLLDESGKQLASREFAACIDDWQTAGDDVVFVIGGPDGVSDAVLQRAGPVWALSRLTLPHGLARVLFAEQLYRAWSLTAGHPYHRD